MKSSLMATKKQPRCPVCKKPVEIGSGWFPFCSDRCKLTDLSRWLNEEYRVPAEEEDESALDPGEDDGERSLH